jgi:hypothetical protein
MSLLLLFAGTSSGTVTPLTTDNELFLLMPDEVATGVPSRIWAEMSDNLAASAPTSAIQLRIFSLDSSGNRSTAVPLHNMDSLGEAYYYEWTPATSGIYVVTVAAHDGGKHLFKQSHITVRARFDPVALALHDTLVSRF